MWVRRHNHQVRVLAFYIPVLRVSLRWCDAIQDAGGLQLFV